MLTQQSQLINFSRVFKYEMGFIESNCRVGSAASIKYQSYCLPAALGILCHDEQLSAKY